MEASRPEVTSAEVVLWVKTSKPLTVPELYRVRKAVNAVLNRPVNPHVWAKHYPYGDVPVITETPVPR
jgi:hypothetical protein